jgi:hypothetical protein
VAVVAAVAASVARRPVARRLRDGALTSGSSVRVVVRLIGHPSVAVVSYL